MEARRLSTADIAQWIDNDEGLYDWWHRSKLSKNAFIREHRAELETAINNVLGGQKQAHYLKYDRRDPRLHEAFAFEAPPTQVPVAPGKPLLTPPVKTALIVGSVAAVGIGAYWLLTKAPAAATPTGATGGAGTVWKGGAGATGGYGHAVKTGYSGSGYKQINGGSVGPVYKTGGGFTPSWQQTLSPSTPISVQPSASGVVTLSLPASAKWWSQLNILKGSFSDHVYPQYYADHIDLSLDGSPAVAELYWVDGSGIERVSVIAFTSGSPGNNTSVMLNSGTPILQQAAGKYSFAIYMPSGATFDRPPTLMANGNWSPPTSCGGSCMQFTLDGTQGIAIVNWTDINRQSYTTYIVFE